MSPGGGDEGALQPAEDAKVEFRRFFEERHRRLIGEAYLLTGDADEAHDLAQEVLYRAWRNWDKVSRYELRGAWASRVLHNLVVSRWRRRLVALRHSARAESLWSAAISVEHLDVVAALNDLPLAQRRAIVLHDLDGMSVAEVATEMGTPEGTVKSWLSRGRAAIADAVYTRGTAAPVKEGREG